MPDSKTAAAAALRSTLDDRLAQRDRPGAVAAAIGAVRAGEITVDDLYTRVLGPLLVDTGSSWQRGSTQVWEEHYATATVRTIVEGLYAEVQDAAARAESNGKTAVLASPAEEHHDLGLRMLADRMSMAGWNAQYLGADTPVDQIVEAAQALHADLVVLSVATHYNRMMLREIVDELKRRLTDARVGVGGPAFAVDRNWPADELLTLAELGLSLPKD